LIPIFPFECNDNLVLSLTELSFRADVRQCWSGMSARILFITGTDTGVGKTTFAATLAALLRQNRVNVAALKPVCSGGRDDARVLERLAGAGLKLAEVNPWHFRAAIAPVLAARRERKRVLRRHVLAHIQRMARRFEVLVVEGAGGLLSPIGEDFDSRDLIVALNALPIIVCPNKLGAVNQVLLVLEALPRKFAARAKVVLIAQSKRDRASRTNKSLLAERIGQHRIILMPWLNRRKK
jgi:dethiobiotin synthetase